jgi:cysteinyl-tRNA synthetase
MSTPRFPDVSVRFYDTRLKTDVDFEPRDEGKVSIYACGPTPYDHPHLGHGRTAFTYDMIRRFLRYVGYDVTLVSNITDIEDKIIARAAKENKTEPEIAQVYEKSYRDQLDSLGIEHPDHIPHATQYVAEMLELITRLVDKGVAYQTSTGVYFSVPDYPGYGELSHRTMDDLLESAGARVDVDEEKKSPLDFALWKNAKPGEPSWPSAFGDGRPGWHIECSAMAVGLLGEGFDIHGGGSDLVFPHHENEIAQSQGAGDDFARYWIHSAMLNIAGEKMSKSLNNFIMLSDGIAAQGPRTLRLFFLQTHYRTTMEISDEALAAAKSALDRLDTFARRCAQKNVNHHVEPDQGIVRQFVDIMSDDFKTPQALALIFDVVRDANTAIEENKLDEVPTLYSTVYELITVLGIDIEQDSREGVDVEWVEAKIEDRNQARAEKDFARSDAIRDELANAGVVIEDTKDGTTWHVATKTK